MKVDVPGAVFDEDAADYPIRFIECLKLTGESMGRPFKLLPFQTQIVRDLFGWYRADNFRLFRQAFISFGRKNGKSQLIAALALYALIADGEPGPQVYSAAVDREQASLTFNMAAMMIRQNRELSKICRIVDSQKKIECKLNGGVYKALSSEGYSKHGLNPSFVIFDELHGWKNEELWNALTTGSGARKQPLFVYITTAGTDDNSIWGREYNYAKKVASGVLKNPSYYVSIYEVPHDANWRDESLWHLANPALGTITSIDALRELFTKAESVPFEAAKFRRLYLNQFVTTEDKWIDYHRWLESAGNVDKELLKGRVCYAGLDLSSKEDLTALVLVFPWDDSTYKILPYFFMPAEAVERHRKTDKVEYDIWTEQGYILTTPGDIVDYSFVKAKLVELTELYIIKELAYDRWNSGPLVQDLEASGITTLVPFGQGFASMSAPTKEVANLVLQKRLHHGNNPVLNFMADCASVVQDAAENIKIVKPERRKSSKRVDGLIATVMGLDRAMRHGLTKPSVYESRGLLVF